ncbi:MAG: hypothetical protein ACRYHC_05905 [Janthinobacterium lividum]
MKTITDDLSRLITLPEPAAASTQVSRQTLEKHAATVLRDRQLRKKFLPADLFREPGWDMLIAIYIADRAGHPTNVKALVAMVDAPATTSQRWIDHLDRLGLVSRATDPLDRRRIEVSLTDTGQTALESYLLAVAPR